MANLTESVGPCMGHRTVADAIARLGAVIVTEAIVGSPTTAVTRTRSRGLACPAARSRLDRLRQSRDRRCG